jgi:hypothetical protein
MSLRQTQRAQHEGTARAHKPACPTLLQVLQAVVFMAAMGKEAALWWLASLALSSLTRTKGEAYLLLTVVAFLCVMRTIMGRLFTRPSHHQ